MSDVCVRYFCCIYYKVQNNELSVDEIPSRALMWRKARENKNGEYKNVDVKDIANKIVSSTLNFFGLFLITIIHVYLLTISTD